MYAQSDTHIDGDEMDLGVTVLSGLGGGHVDNLQEMGMRSARSAQKVQDGLETQAQSQ